MQLLQRCFIRPDLLLAMWQLLTAYGEGKTVITKECATSRIAILC